MELESPLEGPLLKRAILGPVSGRRGGFPASRVPIRCGGPGHQPESVDHGPAAGGLLHVNAKDRVLAVCGTGSVR